MTKDQLENKIKDAIALFPNLKQLTFYADNEECILLEKEFNAVKGYASYLFYEGDIIAFNFEGIEIKVIKKSFVPGKIVIRK